MKYEILADGAFPVLEVELDSGEKIVSEAGAMSWMDDGFEIETSMRGGVLSSFKRAVFSGESLFQNVYEASRDGVRVAFVGGQPGSIVPLDLQGGGIILERGAYVASTEDVTLDSRWEGLSGLFKEGLFVIRASGEGTVFFSAYGDVLPVEVDGEYVVDSGYAVAWDETLDYGLKKIGKIRAFLFGDQFVMSFKGKGRLWIQSRSPYSFANWIHPFRRVRKNSD